MTQRVRGTCRWCGALKVTVGRHSGKGNNPGGNKLHCYNPDCPRRGQVQWVVPTMCLQHARQCKTLDGENDPGDDNAVRTIEDAFFP